MRTLKRSAVSNSRKRSAACTTSRTRRSMRSYTLFLICLLPPSMIGQENNDRSPSSLLLSSRLFLWPKHRRPDAAQDFPGRTQQTGLLVCGVKGCAVSRMSHPVSSVVAKAHVREELVFQSFQLRAPAFYTGEVVHRLAGIDSEHNRRVDDM